MRNTLLYLAALSFSALAQDAVKELDTPYVPTPQAVVDRMLELAQVKSGETVVDLGSGDGRIMIEAARRYGARGFGVEIDPRLVQRSKEAAARAGVAGRVRFLQQDLFKTDFHEANVLTLYLLPDVNLALRPKILAELKPGSRVVSHDYAMGDWLPDAHETVTAPDKTVGARKESQVYLWTVPARMEGEWALAVRSEGKTRFMRLSLEQRYQILSGSIGIAGGKSLRLPEAKMHGDELRLVLPASVVGEEEVVLTGRVAAGSASGTARTPRGTESAWSAKRRS